MIKNKSCLMLILFICIYKVYSSVVEQTAHNGVVVGSIPTKLNQI